MIECIEANSTLSVASPHEVITSDRGLATRLAAREHDALAELYDRYSARAFGLAYRVLGDTQAAEDAVQDAFLWTWEHAARIDESRGSPGALLLTITRRRAIDAFRRRSRAVARASDFPLDAIDAEAYGSLAGVEDKILGERMKQGLLALAPAQREAVELAYFEGKTQAQIAELQEVPLGTVKSRLRLAMGGLGRFLGGSRDGNM